MSSVRAQFHENGASDLGGKTAWLDPNDRPYRQHYESQMSAIFFDALSMPKPDFDLGVRSGSHAEQTARIMVGFERICLDEKRWSAVMSIQHWRALSWRQSLRFLSRTSSLG